MAEITVSISTFRKLAKEYEPCKIFESADAVAMAFGSHLIRAFKSSPRRLFRGERSVPMSAIGYSGISSWQMAPLEKQ